MPYSSFPPASYFTHGNVYIGGFPDVSVLKNLPAKVGATGDTVSTPGLRRYLEEEKASHPSIFAWEIPRKEGPGELHPKGLQRVGHN